MIDSQKAQTMSDNSQTMVPADKQGESVVELESVIIRFAGDSGDGMQLTGTQFTNTVAALGNDLVVLPNGYMASPERNILILRLPWGETVRFLGGEAGNLVDVSRLATLAPIGHGGKERAVRLQHELVEGGDRQRVADVLAVLEGQDAGEAHQRAHGHYPLHGGGVVGEAMEHAADPVGERLELGQRVLQRVTLMDDAVQTQFGGDFQMLAEERGLRGFVALVIGGGAAGFLAGQPVVVHAGLAEGDDLTDPVVDASRAALDGHIVLSRSLAMAGHFPAVDVLASVSRVMTDVVTADHRTLARRVREVLSAYKDAADLVEVGAYVSGTNPRVDAALRCISELNAFLCQEPGERFALAETLNRLRKALDGKPADGKPLAAVPKQEERRV